MRLLHAVLFQLLLLRQSQHTTFRYVKRMRWHLVLKSGVNVLDSPDIL